jgi:GT2 family glycosyltransferase
VPAAELIPVSVVVPTCDRAAVLRRMMESLASQSVQPARLVLVDASADRATRDLCGAKTFDGLGSEVVWIEATAAGAANQRNQGMRECRHAVIGFFDDDILFEPDCVARLWQGLRSDDGLGGVNALITNQRYEPPGHISRAIFRFMAGRPERSYAGRVLGPAINLLPEDRDDLPELMPTEWLNTTCTLYRREALPDPPFARHFTGYSLMEDLALSLAVSRHWKLANARTARIFHDSRPGTHKDDAVAVSRMELVNRHYVMVSILERRRTTDYAKLVVWESFQLAACAIQRGGGPGFWQMLHGKMLGLRDIVGNPRRPGF